MKKSETSLTEFLIEDFKDTSAKLESTDKKVQFIVQIYTALVTAIISASIFFLASHFSKIVNFLKNNDGLKTNNIFFLIFCIILLFLFGFAVCVYYYSLKGNYIHAIYLNRMNFLRNVIFEKIGDYTGQIENFFYTKRSIIKVGMGETLNKFLVFTISLYISVAIWIFDVFSKSILCFFVIFIGVFMIVLLLHRCKTKHYNKKADKVISNSWEKENNEIS